MAMGYAGFVKFYRTPPATDEMTVLCTSSGLNLTINLITSTGVWGAGWYNAAETTHYADDAVFYEGDVSLDLQGYANFWNFIRSWCIEHRAYPVSADISPDAQRVFRYRAATKTPLDVYDYTGEYGQNGLYNSTMSINTSAGSAVTCSLGAMALTRDMYNPEGTQGSYSAYKYIYNRGTQGVDGDDWAVTQPADMDAMRPLNPNGDNIDPIPYWRTNAEVQIYTGGNWTNDFQTGLEAIDWSVSLTNNATVLYTCNGDREASAVLMGPISATADTTLYCEDGVFDPILGPDGTEGTLTSPYSYAANTRFVVYFNKIGANQAALFLPATAISSDDYAVKGGTEFTTRGFSMQGFGGKTSDMLTDALLANADYPFGFTTTEILPPMLMSIGS